MLSEPIKWKRMKDHTPFEASNKENFRIVFLHIQSGEVFNSPSESGRGRILHLVILSCGGILRLCH